MSILVPLLIAASIRKSVANKTVFRVLQDIVITIIHPITLHFELVSLNWTKNKLLRLTDKSYAPEFEEIVWMIKELEAKLTKHIRLQVGLETTYQTILNTILLFYAYSSTRTNQELAAVFQEDDFNFLGITLNSETVVAILLALNLLILIRTHFQGIVEALIWREEQ